MVRAVVLDIEGTTSSTWFVHETLYPYSRQHFARYLAEHADRDDVAEMIDEVRRLVGEPSADADRVEWWLNHWLDLDQKVTPLKAFQGWIWAEGFAAGQLMSHFFDDAIPAMRRWHKSGLELDIFSSGSVNAQLAWFGHTPDGSVLDLISHHFDTENIGPKREPESFRAIAAAIGNPPDQIVFLSDLVAELDAAREAGWHTVGVRRHGDQYFDAGVGDHLQVTSFDQLDLNGPVPSVEQTT
ncbi:MAG TPA: acireductone synthase [Ilumatobacteraceae bacterium]|nr:acireductone synthase [Ilumatobacteraceae bacterium]